MDEENKLYKLKEMIGNGELNQVLNILLKNKDEFINDDGKVNELLSLKNQYQDFKQKEILGIKANPKIRNEITLRLLEFIDKIRNEDDMNSLVIPTTERHKPKKVLSLKLKISVLGISIAIGVIFTIVVPSAITLISTILVLSVIAVYMYLES